MNGPANHDQATVEGFGDEWTRFDQSELTKDERAVIFDAYFSDFAWSSLPPDPVGLDVGYGSGRWTVVVAPRVGHLLCVDASPAAAAVARRTLTEAANTAVAVASVDRLPVPDASLNFAYSLGVLHHVPDTAAAIAACARALKPGADPAVRRRPASGLTPTPHHPVGRQPGRRSACLPSAGPGRPPGCGSGTGRGCVAALVLSGPQLLCHEDRRSGPSAHATRAALHPRGDHSDDDRGRSSESALPARVLPTGL